MYLLVNKVPTLIIVDEYKLCSIYLLVELPEYFHSFPNFFFFLVYFTYILIDIKISHHILIYSNIYNM